MSDGFSSLSDLDLSDPLLLKRVIREYQSIETLREDYSKIRDLYIEILNRYEISVLTDFERYVFGRYFIKGYLQAVSSG